MYALWVVECDLFIRHRAICRTNRKNLVHALPPMAATLAAEAHAETEKRAGWRQHGILVVAERDPRLTWAERELVRQLGIRLYGPRRDAPDG
jgi:hypothetical protein